MFNFLKKMFTGEEKKDTNVQIDQNYTGIKNTGLNTTDRRSNIFTSGSINLAKQNEKITISLAKKGIQDITAEVKLCLDKSGSMDGLYRSGMVQRTLERLAPLAFRFDDNGEMETYLFNNFYEEVPALTMSNLVGYSDKYLRGKVNGGTNYSPSIYAIIEEARKGNIKFPAYVIFITDGENFDRMETEKAIIEASNYDIYVMFVGIGYERFTFLEKLNNLEGRKWDNAGFIKFQDLDKVSDEVLYDKLLEEFLDKYKSGQFKTGKISLRKKDA